MLAGVIGQRRQRAPRLDVDELPVEEQAEVPVEARVRIGDGQDERILQIDGQAIEPLQHQRVRIAAPDRRHERLVEVDVPLEPAVVVHQVPAHRRRRVEAPQLERNHGGAVALFPQGGREARR